MKTFERFHVNLLTDFIFQIKQMCNNNIDNK